MEVLKSALHVVMHTAETMNSGGVQPPLLLPRVIEMNSREPLVDIVRSKIFAVVEGLVEGMVDWKHFWFLSGFMFLAVTGYCIKELHDAGVLGPDWFEGGGGGGGDGGDEDDDGGGVFPDGFWHGGGGGDGAGGEDGDGGGGGGPDGFGDGDGHDADGEEEEDDGAFGGGDIVGVGVDGGEEVAVDDG